jgi:CRP-like cAMP-binding protein
MHKKYVHLMTPFLHLSVGKTFGELALQLSSNDKPRAASVVCLEDCVLATLRRVDY